MKKIIVFFFISNLLASYVYPGGTRDWDETATDLLSHHTAPTANVPYSLACWFNMERTESSNQYIQYIGDKDSTSFLVDNAHTLVNSAEDFIACTEGYCARTGVGLVQEDTWHHGVGVFAATNDRSAYLDGGNKGTDSTDRSVGNTDSYAVGVDYLATNGNWWGGYISALAIWDTNLSDNQVKELAAGSWPRYVATKNNVVMLPIWGNEDPEPDLSGGNRDATVSGPVSANAGAPIYFYSGGN